MVTLIETGQLDDWIDGSLFFEGLKNASLDLEKTSNLSFLSILLFQNLFLSKMFFHRLLSTNRLQYAVLDSEAVLKLD